MITGRILHLQRLSTEDGPGIRTTVFLKGCPLRCVWCHNPESMSRERQLQWHDRRCLSCGSCLDVCADDNLSIIGANGCKTLVINREGCKACGQCAEACPTGSLEILGKDVSVHELVEELLKDRAYYDKSGGGVTLSGGEPTMQADFAEALLRELKHVRISTALDTCGHCSPESLTRLLPYTDIVLFDLKLLDPERHLEATGQPNATILGNLLHVRDYRRLQSRRIDLWIRTPLIPNATSDDENLSSLSRYIYSNLMREVTRWELCAFNNLCREQYRRLDMPWPFADTPLLTAQELTHCERVVRNSGVSPETVFVTGAKRIASS
jgi:pyruvate formate lyase activating enzyme